MQNLKFRIWVLGLGFQGARFGSLGQFFAKNQLVGCYLGIWEVKPEEQPTMSPYHPCRSIVVSLYGVYIGLVFS